MLYSQSFQDTQGKLDISNSGQAIYTLPIAMPASLNNVGPVINLVYASGQNGGIAGQGWSINSISAITRMSTRQDIDGFKDGVDFDDNDKLALDGQRLLIKTGSYWSNGSTYETEVQSNSKIELQVFGTIYTFTVTNPDGSRTWYGGANASDLNAFYITRFEDTFGNFMTYNYNVISPNNVAAYTYETENIIGYDYWDNSPIYGDPIINYVPAIESSNTLTISEINFSANITTNPTALNKIKFTYKLSNRNLDKAYLKGEKIQNIDILDKIEVFTNSLLFKKYQLTHVADANGYQRVSQLQEFNGAGESANPVLFQYRTTPSGVIENKTYYSDSYNATIAPDLSGDFDGDSHLDFISNGQVYTNLFNGSTNPGVALPFSSTSRQIFAATTLREVSTLTTTGFKLNQKQSLVNAEETANEIRFNVYNYNNQVPLINGFSSSYMKIIPFDNGVSYNPALNTNTIINIGSRTNFVLPVNKPCITPSLKSSNEYLEGDFNGDGLSETIVIKTINEKYFFESKIYNKRANNGAIIATRTVCEFKTKDDGKEFYLLNLDQRASNILGQAGYVKLLNDIVLKGDKRFVMDFNSDGKSDVLVMTGQNYKIISFKQLSTAPWIELETIGEGTISHYSTSKQILFGDYNGDGKPDILIPDSNGGQGHTFWHIYYSNPRPAGGSFFTVEDLNITEYAPGYGSDIYAIFNNYFAMDINKDGKTDLVRVQSDKFRPCGDVGTCGSNRDTKWRVFNYVNNLGSNGAFNLDYVSPSDHYSDDNSLPIIIASGYKRNGVNNEMLVTRYHGNGSFNKSLTFINFKKNISEDILLTKVTQSGGTIIDDIVYQPMAPAAGVNNGLGNLSDFYSSTESLFYPFVELKQLTTNWLVSTIQNTAVGFSKTQMFKYHGFAVNLNSIGTIGFMKTARSNWFKATNSNKVVWSITENAPFLRGAMIKSFTQMLLTTEHCLYNSTLPLINKSENFFTQATDPVTKRYSLLLKIQKSTDYLNNTTKQTNYNNYTTDYFLPNSITTSNYLGTTLQGSTTTNTVFDSNISGTGNNYYIGRPTETTTITTAYGNTQTMNEKYFYTNGNITRSEKKANNDLVTIVEQSDYFANGLLKNKTISAIGTNTINAVTPKTTSVTYDATNRFIKTKTDIEGLVTTNLTYHPIYGTVLTQQNPFGQVTTSTIDNWGKQTRVTDFLNKSVNYIYTRGADTYTTTQNGDDGSSSVIISDALGRVIRKGSKNLNGIWNFVTSEYNYLGQKTRDSEPFVEGANPTQWSSYEYDDYSRSTKTISYTGKIVNTIYNGLTVTANDGILVKTKTMNANGHVIAATDTPGGTILYKYDALGNLIESDYDGIKSNITYDNWGRKTSLVDTSAGTYTYTYNAFGQPLTEGTPKGITNYTYTPAGNPNIIAGKLLTKSTSGRVAADGTSITSTYTYDPVFKWIKQMNVVNPNDGNSSYEYFYDPATKQLNKTIEKLYPVSSSTPFATFTKELAFDLFGRVNNETSTVLSHGKTSSKVITHVYKNGVEWQLLEGAKVLWQANTVNARGQLLTGTIGNGITVNNSYDFFGYNTQAKHDLGATNVMTLNTVFEPTLGNLTSRFNSMFNKSESFQYDNLDRLIKWEGGAPEFFQDIKFPTTTEGFVGNGGVGSSISNYLQQLKVVAKGFEAGASKTIIANSTTGKTIDIQLNYTKVSGTSGVFARITENDPSNGLIVNSTDIGELSSNTYQSQYTMQSNGNAVKLWFYINDAVLTLTKTAAVLAIPPKGTSTATFYIDNLLVTAKRMNTQNYDDRGRITANNLGTYNYLKTGKPYQNSSVITTAEADAYYATKPLQNISYNAFKAPIEIIEKGIDRISFGYNAMEQRSIMYSGSNNIDKFARPFRNYYSADGSMEINATFAAGSTTIPTAVELITYIGGSAYTATVVNKITYNSTNPAGAGGLFYFHRDYQGSILAITNSVGAVVEKRLFDAWGAVTAVQDGAGNVLTKLTFTDRGYTGHEHLQSVGLINMNARLYDPKLHRFLQPDALIQEPYNTQNYNRYGYCVNNPLKYTDISGNDFGLSAAIIIAVSVATASYLTINFLTDQPITFEGVVSTAIMAAFTGAVTFGIGEAFSATTNIYLRATYSALAHGTFQGGMTAVQGGNFWNGFAAGSLASLASSAWQGGSHTTTGADGAKTTTNFKGISGTLEMGKTAGTLVFGTIAGGAGASLTGGNFWQGAVTGLIVSGLNHAMHGGFGKKYDLNVLEDYEGANGAGHQALAGELENGKLQYISKDGTNENGGVYGDSKYTDKVFNNINEINDYYGTNVSPGKRYDIVATYRLTKSQMNTALTTARTYAHQTYNLFTNSCTTIVEKALYNAFKPRYTLFSPIPNASFQKQQFSYRNYLSSVKTIN